MTTRTSGRHRAAVRPKTPLTVLSETVQANAGTVGRRSAVIAASSGLVVTMGLPAADAAPVGEAAEAPPQPLPVAEPTPAEPVVPDVSAPDDVQLAAFESAVAAVTEPPEPEPEPEPVVTEAASSRTGDRASRSGGERTEAPVAEAAATSSETTAEPAAASSSGSGIISIAARYVGTPYVYGGTTPAGFDCSGYVQYVYAQVGISLPRTAAAQANAGARVSRSEARPGDIVSFVDGGGVYHNGIYAGGNELYDSPRSGKSVSKRAIWTSSVIFTRVG